MLEASEVNGVPDSHEIYRWYLGAAGIFRTHDYEDAVDSRRPPL